MANIIPPLLSNTPPPIIGALDDDLDDEFDEFKGATDLSYDCESPLPQTPVKTAADSNIPSFDINSNSEDKILSDCYSNLGKDFQDKRKNDEMFNSEDDTNLEIITILNKLDLTNVTNIDLSAPKLTNHADTLKIGDNSEKHTEAGDNEFSINKVANTPTDEITVKSADDTLCIPNSVQNLSKIENTNYVAHDLENTNDVIKTEVLNSDGTLFESKDFFQADSSVRNDLNTLKTDVRISEGDISDIKIPKGDISGIKVPKGDISGIKVPEGDISGIKVPEGDISGIKVPEGDISGIKVSEGDVSDFKVPEIDILASNIDNDDVSNDHINISVFSQGNSATESNSANVTWNCGTTEDNENVLESNTIVSDIDTDISGYFSKQTSATHNISIEPSENDENKFKLRNDYESAITGKLADPHFETSLPINDSLKSINVEQDVDSKSLKTKYDEENHEIGLQETTPFVADDDFGDFEFPQFSNDFQGKPQMRTENLDCFQNLKICSAPQGSQTDKLVSKSVPEDLSKEQRVDEPEEDEFGDFEDFQKPQEDDDFGNFESHEDKFADFETYSRQSSTEASNFPFHIDSSNAAEKAEEIVKEVFKMPEVHTEDFIRNNILEDNDVLNNLKEITETNALNYQWNKSSSQKVLLKALNMDIRNILYGPSWNPSMPIFAATLSVAPLEPIKTEITAPVPAPSQSAGEVPTAQFDWDASGLLNPLDSQDTKPLPETSVDTFSPIEGAFDTELDQVTSDLEAQSELKLPSKPQDTESVNSLKLSDFMAKEEPKQEPVDDDFEDFTSYQSPTPHNQKVPEPHDWVPLRETHIANECQENDDFDDFQMVLPQDDTTQRKVTMKNNLVTNPINEIPKFTQSSQNSWEIKQVEELKNDFEEIPVLQPSILEPLKPVVVHPTPKKEVTQINWPNPGISEEDIDLFVSDFVKPVSKPVVVEDRTPIIIGDKTPIVIGDKTSIVIGDKTPLAVGDKLVGAKTQIAVGGKPPLTIENNSSKKEIEDDDEWSDFVSVKEPGKPRISTPDLTLSVFNLATVQPVKKPAPVVTHAHASQVGPTLPNTVQTPNSSISNQVQPFITSQAYNQMIQPLSNGVQANYGGYFIYPQPTAASQERNASEDDDWGDFVCSQPQQSTNGISQISSMFGGWSSQANIITNPGHFDHFTRSAANSEQLSQVSRIHQSASKSQLNATRSVPIPELDFIAPKTRTNK